MGPGCGHGYHGAVLEGEGRVHLEYACPVWHRSLTVAQRMAMVRGYGRVEPEPQSAATGPRAGLVLRAPRLTLRSPCLVLWVPAA